MIGKIRRVKIREIAKKVNISDEHVPEKAIGKMSAMFVHFCPNIESSKSFEAVFRHVHVYITSVSF